ncbi:hypothetical protein P8452_37576 [Trifolium repens]|nr:hypothetical protein P8452_37576 [Trifolium repens]
MKNRHLSSLLLTATHQTHRTRLLEKLQHSSIIISPDFVTSSVTLHPLVTSVSSERTFRDSGLNRLSLKV